MGGMRDMSRPLVQMGGYNMPCPYHFFLFRFCIWRGYKNKNNICHILCLELFMLDVTRSQVDVSTESGVASLILVFYKF